MKRNRELLLFMASMAAMNLGVPMKHYQRLKGENLRSAEKLAAAEAKRERKRAKRVPT